MSKFLFEPTPNEEAIDFLRSKRPLNVGAFRGLLPELQAYAFTVSGVSNASALQGIRDLVAEVPGGADFRAVKRQIVEELGKHIPLEGDLFDDEEAAAKHEAMLARRAEMVVRNNAFQAYSLSTWKELDESRDIFTHWQYLTVGDERVRASHRALDNVVLPQGHPFWQTHFPPWEFGCRCQVVGITAEEAEELAAADAAKPEEERVVLDGPLLTRLENEGVIVRKVGGVPVRVNVTSARERNEPGAWRWEPRDLALSFADLRTRYDAQTMAMWESWAKQTDAGQGQSVWEWVSRGLSNAPVVAVPAPVARASTALGTALTGKLEPVKNMRKAEKARVARVLGIIDEVHGDGPLPVVPVGNAAGKNALGSITTAYNRQTKETRVVRLDFRRVDQGGTHPELTLVHEIGHFLDVKGMPVGSGNIWATDDLGPSGGLDEWWQAVKNSQAYQNISGSKRSYYVDPKECWARAYAQFIAEESGDALMLSQVAAIRGTAWGWRQWEETDFAPIRAAMKKRFENLNWMKGTQP
jgi:SPP1 gp7 family putative phage head morphogenesis protein